MPLLYRQNLPSRYYYFLIRSIIIISGLFLFLNSCSKIPENSSSDISPKNTVAVQKTAIKSEELSQLEQSAKEALRENRIYSPQQNNALEYYLLILEKEKNNANAISAVTDIIPYLLAAIEQSIARQQWEEVTRLVGLLQRADPNQPLLIQYNQAIELSKNKTVATKTNTNNKLNKIPEENSATHSTDHSPKTYIASENSDILENNEQKNTNESEDSLVATKIILQPISTPAPRYPIEALRGQVSGSVTVDIMVGSDGLITTISIVESNPARVFDREVLRTIRRWKFQPPGKPVVIRRAFSFNPTD